MVTENSTIMRPPEAATYLTLSVQRLAKLRLEGTGTKFVKAGRSILYVRENLDEWLRARVRQSTSDPGKGRP